MKTKPLTQSQLDELRKILAGHGVQIDLRIQRDGSLDLTDEKQIIIDAIAAEFLKSGLAPSGKPNSRARELGDLTYRINNIELECSFCGKKQADVVQLVAGPQAFICNECVQLCFQAIGTDHPDWLEQHKKFIDEHFSKK